MYKVYTALTQFIVKFLDLLMIHWMKFSLLALFMASVSLPTLFNLVLFILFLLISTASYSSLRRLWRVTIIFNSVIVLCMYTYDVFFS